MSDTEAPPPTTADKRNYTAGLSLIGSSVAILALLGALVVCLLVMQQMSQTNGALASALSQQRAQFTACKDKPATARGCTTPVAAEPSVIVKEGGRGLPGLPGATGALGPQGPQGPAGPAGPVGPIGKAGPPPGCALLSTACVGASGPAGPAGADGKDGKDGKDGLTPACWFEAAQCLGADGKDGKDGKDGAQGVMGAQGVPGRGITKTECVNGKWIITYSDGAQEAPQGSCETPGP